MTSHAVEVVAAGDRDRGRRVERAGEHAEPVEDQPFVVVEELVRPLDRRPQRLVALDAAAALAGEEPEPFVEVRGDLGRAHRRRARRGQLDRQRDPVDPPADLADRRPLRVVPLRSAPASDGAVGEQAHRRAVDRARRRSPTVGASRATAPAPHRSPATSSASRLVASTAHVRDSAARPRRRTRSLSSRRCSQLSSTSSSSRTLQVLDDALGQRQARALHDSRASRRRPAPSPRRRRRAASSQNHAPSAKRGTTSAATWTARRVLPTPPVPVRVTSDASSSASPRCERRRRRGRRTTSPAPGRFPANASSDRRRRELPARLGMRRPGRPAPAAPGRAAGARRGRRSSTVAVADQLLGGQRHHDLAAVRGRHQPRRPVHRRAVVVAVAQLGRAGVDAHPHPQRLGQRPVLAAERELRRDRRIDGVGRGRRTPRARRRPSSSPRDRRAPRPPSRRISSWRAERRLHRVRDAPATAASNPRDR